MCGLLALLFIAVPIAEIVLILRAGAAFGALPTIAVMVVTAAVGAYLARQQGLAAWRRLAAAVQTGEALGSSAVEALLILVAGVLLLTPGFLTDGVGLLLLVPVTRRPIARHLMARWARSGSLVVLGGMPGDDEDPPPPGVIDV